MVSIVIKRVNIINAFRSETVEISVRKKAEVKHEADLIFRIQNILLVISLSAPGMKQASKPRSYASSKLRPTDRPSD